jgi:serine/threonine protein phosphatase 1
MPEYVIGDIHGCARALDTLLHELRPGEADSVIFLGDYVDRGPDSFAVIERILDLQRTTTVIALQGNHERMMLAARDEAAGFQEWMRHGGDATLGSYKRSGKKGTMETIPGHHWTFLLEQLLDYWETDETIFVHACVDPTLPLDDQPAFLLFWQPFSDPMVHCSGKQVICGHTSQKAGMPVRFEKGICIDTYAHGGGWLTAYDTGARRFMQANERGELRTFGLAELNR